MINPVIVGRKIHFISEGGSVAPQTRAQAEAFLKDMRARFPKIQKEAAKATVAGQIAAYERGIELAKANGL